MAIAVGVSVGVSVAACGGSDSPLGPGSGRPGIQFTAGGSGRDTVDTQLTQALVVEVRGADGAVRRGAVVRFEAAPAAGDPSTYPPPSLYACRVDVASCPTFFGGGATVDTTDASGRTRVLIRLGGRAGAAALRVSVPELGYTETASYAVDVGQPASVSLGVADTAAVVGARVTYSPAVLDRHGNRRGDAVAITAATASPGVEVEGAGVVGRAVGQYAVIARAGAFADTGVLRVVPAGRLVVWDPAARSLRMVDLDGAADRVVASKVASNIGVFPRFGQGGARVSLHSDPSGDDFNAPSLVMSTDTLGGTRTVVEAADGLGTPSHPRVLRDGTLLFLARTAGERYDDSTFTYLPAVTSVMRAAPGEVPVVVADVPDYAGGYGGADLSPDGTRLAYVANTAPGRPGGLRVLDLTAGTTVLLDAGGYTPRWSAAGDRLVYFTRPVSDAGGLDGCATVINADGTGRRVLAPNVFSPGLAWSPDGVWIVGRDAGVARLRVVRVADGSSVVLRIVRLAAADGVSQSSPVDYFQPDWR